MNEEDIKLMRKGICPECLSNMEIKGKDDLGTVFSVAWYCFEYDKMTAFILSKKEMGKHGT